MRSTQLMARHGTLPPSATTTKQFGLASVLLITFILLFTGRAHAFSQIVAFGDSLSDNGNLFALTGGAPPAPPSPPYFMGRFSNGPVWVELVASNRGLSLDDYAFGGAETGNGLGIDMLNQIAGYLAGVGNVADPNAMYTIWGGANDILNNPGGEFAAVIAAVPNIKTGIDDLLAAGAQNFLILGLPDLGITPQALAGTPAQQAGATAVSNIFNQNLALMVSGVAGANPGANFQYVDVFTILNDILANAGTYGITNTTDACLTGLTPCAFPDEYAFWDAIHPTRVLHSLLADSIVIPVPAAVWLFGSALGLLGWMRRRVA